MEQLARHPPLDAVHGQRCSWLSHSTLTMCMLCIAICRRSRCTPGAHGSCPRGGLLTRWKFAIEAISTGATTCTGSPGTRVLSLRRCCPIVPKPCSSLTSVTHRVPSSPPPPPFPHFLYRTGPMPTYEPPSPPPSSPPRRLNVACRSASRLLCVPDTASPVASSASWVLT